MNAWAPISPVKIDWFWSDPKEELAKLLEADHERLQRCTGVSVERNKIWQWRLCT